MFLTCPTFNSKLCSPLWTGCPPYLLRGNGFPCHCMKHGRHLRTSKPHLVAWRSSALTALFTNPSWHVMCCGLYCLHCHPVFTCPPCWASNLPPAMLSHMIATTRWTLVHVATMWAVVYVAGCYSAFTAIPQCFSILCPSEFLTLQSDASLSPFCMPNSAPLKKKDVTTINMAGMFAQCGNAG